MNLVDKLFTAFSETIKCIFMLVALLILAGTIMACYDFGKYEQHQGQVKCSTK